MKLGDGSGIGDTHREFERRDRETIMVDYAKRVKEAARYGRVIGTHSLGARFGVASRKPTAW